jgi:hypothetical protein
MITRSYLYLLLPLVLFIASCSNNSGDDIETYSKERQAFLTDISQKFTDSNIDGAQTVFTAKKDSLKSKCQAAKAKAAQGSSEEQKKFVEIEMSGLEIFTTAMAKNTTKSNQIGGMMTELGNVCN